MSGSHNLWHLIVLGTTLAAAAGAALVLLVPLALDETPPGLDKAKPFVAALFGAAVLLLGVEWLGVH